MSDLFDAIDSAAAKLLEAAGFGDKVEGVEPPRVDLPDRVKAFQAVVAWAETRNDLRPPEKEKSKFDDIRRKFGEAAKRRGRPAAAESGSAGPDGGDAAPTAPTADLFDA
jgi:hypothetical protein